MSGAGSPEASRTSYAVWRRCGRTLYFVLGLLGSEGASLEPARMWGARGVGVAAAHHLLAAVVLWAAFSSAASFTDPSDGTISHPSPVVIDLLPRDASTLRVRMRTLPVLSVAFVSTRVISVACSLYGAHTCGLVCTAAREPCALVDW